MLSSTPAKQLKVVLRYYIVDEVVQALVSNLLLEEYVFYWNWIKEKERLVCLLPCILYTCVVLYEETLLEESDRVRDNLLHECGSEFTLMKPKIPGFDGSRSYVAQIWKQMSLFQTLSFPAICCRQLFTTYETIKDPNAWEKWQRHWVITSRLLVPILILGVKTIYI